MTSLNDTDRKSSHALINWLRKMELGRIEKEFSGKSILTQDRHQSLSNECPMEPDAIVAISRALNNSSAVNR